MRLHLAGVLACVLAFPCVPALAGETLGLEDAVRLAVSRHPLLRVAERGIEAARAREVQARALPNPGFTVAADSVPFSNPGLGNAFAAVSQPLRVAGQGELAGEVAAVERTLAELGRDVVRRDLVRDVTVSFARVLLERERARLARMDLEAARELARAADALVKAGEVAPIERLQAEVEVGRLTREANRLEGQAREASGRLALLVGLPATASFEVAPPGEPGDLPWPAAEEVVAGAIAGRIEMRQAELAVRREDLRRRLAAASVWNGTEASLAAGTFSGLPGFTATVTWPIPVYRQEGEIAEAEANRSRAEDERDRLRGELELEVRSALREAAGARDELALHGTRLVPRASELLDQARRRYRAGEGSGLEVIAARRALAEVMAAREQALFELRSAIARLAAVSGTALSP
ncbi:MAG: TolC family protein [bacterium]|nr:TolC family protein [bacterium]